MSEDESRETGTVKKYVTDRGFGFIEPDRGGEDIFFHISDVEADERELEGGQAVSYSRTQGREGPQAVDVRTTVQASTSVTSIEQTPLRVPQDAAPYLEDRSEIDNPALRLHKAVHFEREDGGGYAVGDLPETFPDVPEEVLHRVRREYEEMLRARPAVAVEGIERPVEWRLAIGLGRASVYETNLTLHPVYGIPFIPGSGLKGAVRSFVMLTLFFEQDDENTEVRALQDPLFRELFGAPDSAPDGARQGSIAFYDAYPTSKPKISPDIMTPHFQDYYQDDRGTTPPTDDMDPTPIPFLTVKDTTFAFWIGERPGVSALPDEGDSALLRATPKAARDSLLSIASHWLERILTEHGVGAKTAVGYGFFPRE